MENQRTCWPVLAVWVLGFSIAAVGLTACASPESHDTTAALYIKAYEHFSHNQEPLDPVEKSELLPVVGEATLPPPGTPIPQDQLEVVGKYVALNWKCLSLLHEAASQKVSRWPREYRDPSGILGMRLRSQARHGARLLYLEALYRAEKGKHDLAAQSVQASFALASSLSPLKEFTAQLTRAACEGLALGGLNRTLNLGAISENELENLARIVAEAHDSAGVPRFRVPRADERRVVGLWKAELRVGQTAIAIERFLATEGALPANLSELAPRFLADVPLDPFDRKPLRYRQTEDGYVVYSIGPNLIDHGGSAEATRLEGDLPFSVERKGMLGDSRN